MVKKDNLIIPNMDEQKIDFSKYCQSNLFNKHQFILYLQIQQ